MLNESMTDKDNLGSGRELQVLLTGSHCLGIFTDEIETIADWRPPTPLPQAPSGVLGVVCIRGRMLTVLDASALFGGNAANLVKIVALTGDEQVALAVEQVAETITVAQEDLPEAVKDALVLAEITDTDRLISVLNTNELFATAMRGHERRRRQF